MTFIIALGVIIILLCSASVFKLMQPKDTPAKNSAKRHPKKVETKKPKAAATVSRTTVTAPKAAAPAKPVAAPAPAAKPVAAARSTLPDVISLNLCADPDKPYAGYELLQALLSCGMRFGSQDMFHRHLKKTGAGPILFSLASCTKTGTFDLSEIGGFSCKGMVLFMEPKKVEAPVSVFQLMLETADQLIQDLGGKVLNAQQQLLKKDDALRIHQQLSAYEASVKASDLVE